MGDASKPAQSVLTSILLGLLAVLPGGWEEAEDPPGQNPLDRPVEGHGGELGDELGPEVPLGLRLGDDHGERGEDLTDLRQMDLRRSPALVARVDLALTALIASGRS